MTGYTRADSVNNIADGNIINASDLDGEFDAVQAAFNSTTGHVHDGTAANGAPITKIGPTQDVVASAIALLPKTTATVDVGSSSLKFKDFFFSGAGSVTGTITAGGFSGTVGATTPAAGTFTSLSDSGNLTFTGTGNRITGDFSNATIASRAIFQTSTVNGSTTITVIPNGTGLSSQLGLYGSSDPANAAWLQIAGNANSGTEHRIAGTLTGTGTYLPITFFTGGSERMRLDTSGNVGIGTSSPSGKLDVRTAAGTSAVMNLSSGSNATVTKFSIQQIGAVDWDIGLTATNGHFAIGGLGGTMAEAYKIVRTGTAIDYQTWNTGGTERMRIDSSGNVGIGQTSPQAKLQINTAADGAQIIVVGAQTANEQTLLFRNSYYTNNATGGIAAIGWIDSGSSGGSLTFKTGTNGGGVTNIPSEKMRIDQAGNVGIGFASGLGTYGQLEVGGNANPTMALRSSTASGTVFAMTAVGATEARINAITSVPMTFFTNNLERMRIDSSGNVGIGTSSPVAKLDVNNAVVARPSTTAQSGELIAAASDYASLPSYTNTALRQYGSTTAGTFYGLTKANLGVLEFVNGSAALIATNGSTPIVFATTSVERMRIDSSGNVNIGSAATTAAAGGRVFDIYNLENTNSSSYALTRLITYNVAGTTTVSADIFKNKAGSFVFNNNETNAAANTSFGIGGSERMRIDSSGNVLVTNPAGLGYGTGSGGTVTQATSKSTGVTLNKPTGQITMNAAALGAGASVIFLLTNSLLAATDSVIVQPNYGANSQSYAAQVTFSGAGGAYIRVTNVSGGSLSEAVTLSFAIIKGATA